MQIIEIFCVQAYTLCNLHLVDWIDFLKVWERACPWCPAKRKDAVSLGRYDLTTLNFPLFCFWPFNTYTKAERLWKNMFPSYLNRGLDVTIASWDLGERFFHILQVHIGELLDSRLVYSPILNNIGHSRPDQATVSIITGMFWNWKVFLNVHFFLLLVSPFLLFQICYTEKRNRCAASFKAKNNWNKQLEDDGIIWYSC